MNLFLSVKEFLIEFSRVLQTFMIKRFVKIASERVLDVWQLTNFLVLQEFQSCDHLLVEGKKVLFLKNFAFEELFSDCSLESEVPVVP